ncbi:MAG TPA: response regulator [Bacteroidales bacterium]|nr:response regulator [Bacteroidales bacterium]
MALNFNNLGLQGKNIVIVEDDLPSVKYYETLLRNSGANVSVFSNGREFIEYVKTGTPAIDLIFMDFLIPFVNGIDCIKIFRKERKDVPVIMITAYSSESARQEAFVAGCTEYLLKPIYPEKICYLIERYLCASQIPYSLMN